MKVHAYIINLRRANNRRESMLERLSAFPEITPEIVDAVDAENTPSVELQALVAPAHVLFRNCHEHSLTNGEVACALSHLNCARRIDSSEDSIGLVLEDDTLLAPDFGKAVVSAAAFLTGIRTPAAVLFSARTWVYGTALTEWSGPGQLFRCSDGVGAYAYMLNRQGCQLLSNNLLPLTAPFDHWFVRRSGGMLLYSTVPHLASFIGNDDDSYLRSGRLAKWSRTEAFWRNRSTISRWILRHFWKKNVDRLFRHAFMRGRFNDKIW